MDYRKHYTILITRGINRNLEGYKERHHIIPRCLGGNDDLSNLVYLTADEHRLAHLLLVKMYPDNHKLIYAARMMFIDNSYRNGRTKSKQYKWIKEAVSLAISYTKTGTKMSEESSIKKSLATKGRKKSEEHNKKNSESHIGNIQSNETKLKIGKSNSGKIPWNKGKTKDTDSRLKKISEAQRGKSFPNRINKRYKGE